MRSLISLTLFAIIFTASPATAAADVIVLNDGPVRQGIIQEETPTAVKLRIKNSVLTIPQTGIRSIGRATPEGNQQLEEKWKVEEERLEQEREKEREEEAKFEAAQKRKGLVNVDSTWVSITEAEKIRKDEIRQQTEEEKDGDEAVETSQKIEEPGGFKYPKITLGVLDELMQSIPDELKEIVDVQIRQEPMGSQMKIFLNQPEEAKEIFDVQVRLQPMGGPMDPIWQSIEQQEVKEKNISVWSDLICTVTNKTNKCLEFGFHAEAYNDSDEMSGHAMGGLAAVEPGQSQEWDVTLRDDIKHIKEITVVLSAIEWWDFKPEMDWDTGNCGCTRFGEDGQSWISPGPTIRR